VSIIVRSKGTGLKRLAQAAVVIAAASITMPVASCFINAYNAERVENRTARIVSRIDRYDGKGAQRLIRKYSDDLPDETEAALTKMISDRKKEETLYHQQQGVLALIDQNKYDAASAAWRKMKAAGSHDAATLDSLSAKLTGIAPATEWKRISELKDHDDWAMDSNRHDELMRFTENYSDPAYVSQAYKELIEEHTEHMKGVLGSKRVVDIEAAEKGLEVIEALWSKARQRRMPVPANLGLDDISTTLTKLRDSAVPNAYSYWTTQRNNHDAPRLDAANWPSDERQRLMHAYSTIGDMSDKAISIYRLVHMPNLSPQQFREQHVLPLMQGRDTAGQIREKFSAMDAVEHLRRYEMTPAQRVAVREWTLKERQARIGTKELNAAEYLQHLALKLQ
jgi:hypothetical protein